jgi:archaellin
MFRPRKTTDDGNDCSEPMTDRAIGRRRFAATIGGLAGFSMLAGCSSGSGSGSADGDTTDGDGGSSAGSDGGSQGTGNTGDESTAQVADTLTVVAAVGTVGADGESIEDIGLTVGLAEGAESVDLTAVTIQYVADDDYGTLVHASVAGSGDPAFATDVISAEDPSDDVLTASSDRYELIVPLGSEVSDGGDNTGLSSLGAGESAELTMTTADGANRTAIVQAPDSLEAESAGATVSL